MMLAEGGRCEERRGGDSYTQVFCNHEAGGCGFVLRLNERVGVGGAGRVLMVVAERGVKGLKSRIHGESKCL